MPQHLDVEVAVLADSRFFRRDDSKHATPGDYPVRRVVLNPHDSVVTLHIVQP